MAYRILAQLLRGLGLVLLAVCAFIGAGLWVTVLQSLLTSDLAPLVAFGCPLLAFPAALVLRPYLDRGRIDP